MLTLWFNIGMHGKLGHLEKNIYCTLFYFKWYHNTVFSKTCSELLWKYFCIKVYYKDPRKHNLNLQLQRKLIFSQACYTNITI